VVLPEIQGAERARLAQVMADEPGDEAAVRGGMGPIERGQLGASVVQGQ